MENVKVDLFFLISEIYEIGCVYIIGFGSGMSENGKCLLFEIVKLGGGKYFYVNIVD